jgi:hypothetical protein
MGTIKWDPPIYLFCKEFEKSKVVSYKLIGGFILFYNGFLTVSENLI